MADACGDEEAAAVACADVAVAAGVEHPLSESADTAKATAANAGTVD